MKKLILLTSLVFCLNILAFAQKPKKHDSIGKWLDSVYAREESLHLKSYYTDRAVALTCEAWYSCAKWAFEQYTQDQSFKITKAQLKTQRKIYRHQVKHETHLFVEAVYKQRTAYVEFLTPKASGRAASYRLITKFPQ